MAGDSAAKPPKPDPRLMRRFPLFADMMEPARRRCPRRIGEYWLGGADTEAGLRENAAAFQRIRLVPRYGLDIARRSSRVDLLGRTYAAPVGVSPAGFMDAFWPGSEMALAAAAERANLPFILSTYSIEPLEAIARAAPSVGWFQLYTFMTMERTLDLAKRAERAGYQVLVLTIDIPVYSKRTRDYRTALEFPPRPSLSLALELLAAPVWSYRLLRKGYPLPGNLMPYAPAGLSREGTLRAVLIRPRTSP